MIGKLIVILTMVIATIINLRLKRKLATVCSIILTIELCISNSKPSVILVCACLVLLVLYIFIFIKNLVLNRKYNENREA